MCRRVAKSVNSAARQNVGDGADAQLRLSYFDMGAQFAWQDFVSLPTVVDHEKIAQERHQERMVNSVVIREVAHQHRKHSSTDNCLHE